MTVLQTVLLFVLVPLGILVLIGLLAAFGLRRAPRSRYRPGEPWNHAPVWWSANPAAVPPRLGQRPAGPSAAGVTQPTGTARGGADGAW